MSKSADLQILLEELLIIKTMDSKLFWLGNLAKWVAGSSVDLPKRFQVPEAKEAHLRFFLQALKDFPTARRSFVHLLCDCLTQTQAIALFALAGLNPDSVTEALRDRLLQQNAKKDPARERRLGDVLLAIFPKKEYAKWLTQLPTELVVDILQLVYFIEQDLDEDQANPWKIVRLDLIESMSVIAAKILATAFSGAMEVNESQVKLRSSPFLVLEHACETLHHALHEGESISAELLFEMADAVLLQIESCRTQIELSSRTVSERSFMFRKMAKSQWGFATALLDRLEGVVKLLVPQNGLISIPNVLAFVANLLESSLNDEHWWNRTQYSYGVHTTGYTANAARIPSEMARLASNSEASFAPPIREQTTPLDFRDS